MTIDIPKLIIFWTNAPVYVILFLFTVMFSLNVFQYLINNNWGMLIPNLGSTTIGKMLMGIHFISGLFCMLGYPIQKLLKLHDCMCLHISIGIILNFCAFITGVLGTLYIIVHGTIGGLCMDIGFAIYGILVIFWSIISCIVSFKLIKYTDKINIPTLSIQIYDFNDRKFLKKFHYHMSNIYAALIYGSFFYRLLYVTSKFCGYLVPDKDHIERYFRPLDQFFQFAFYLIPLLCMILYGLCVHYKYIKLRAFLKLLLTSLHIFSLVLLVENVMGIF